MDFIELQQNLRAARLNPFLAYDSGYNTLSPAPAPRYCRFAWCVQEHVDLPLRFSVSQRELFRPARFAPDTEGPEPVYFGLVLFMALVIVGSVGGSSERQRRKSRDRPGG